MISALDSWASAPGSSPGGTLCCVLRQDTLLSRCLSPPNCWGNLTNSREVTCDGLTSRPRGGEILSATLCYRNRDKLRQLWATHGSKASLFPLYLKNALQWFIMYYILFNSCCILLPTQTHWRVFSAPWVWLQINQCPPASLWFICLSHWHTTTAVMSVFHKSRYWIFCHKAKRSERLLKLINNKIISSRFLWGDSWGGRRLNNIIILVEF